MARAVIAVVDDDPSILTLVQSALIEEGYQVLVWSEGKTAYDFVRENRPHLVILDLRMEHPQAGWIIIHMLRLNPQTADVPVLVCTADVTYVQMRRQILREQRCDVLLKPFSVDDLVDKVAELLAQPMTHPEPSAADTRPGDKRRELPRKPWLGQGRLFQRMGSLRRRR